MITTITRRFHFESAHFLPYVPEWHKCRRMHGHNYEIEVTIQGHPNAGFVMDFAQLDEMLIPIISRIDHRCLNEIEGLENPTAEIISAWFLDQLLDEGLACTEVKVFETKDCWASVTTEAGEADLRARKAILDRETVPA